MKYIKDTVVYIFKRFFSLYIYAVLPAVVLMVTFNPTTLVRTLIHLNETAHEKTFTQILSDLANIKWNTIGYIILSIIVTGFFVAQLSGVISTHMRRGIFTHKGFWRNINFNIISISIIITLVLLCILFLRLLLAIITFVLAKAFEVTNVTVVVYTIISLSVFIFGFLLFLVLNLPALSTSVMQGFNIPRLFKSYGYLSGKLIWSLMLALLLPFIPIVLYMVVEVIWFSYKAYRVSRYISSFILYSSVILYYTALSFVVYFDINNLERDDLKYNIKYLIEQTEGDDVNVS